MATSEQLRGTDEDPPDEAWIRAADGETSIRVRSLANYLEKGGQLIHARLIEDRDDNYTLWVRLADRPGEFRLNHFQNDQPKRYRDVTLAVAQIRRDFRYFGEIGLLTEKRPPKPG